MPRTQVLIRGAAALAFASAVLATGALSSPAQADESQLLPGVSGLAVMANAPGPELVVRNSAGDHHIDSLNLAIQGATVPVNVGAAADCVGTQSESLGVRGGFALRGGAYGIGRDSLVLAQSLPDPNSIDHTSDLDAHTFQLHIAKLAHPQIDVDPVAVVLAAADAAPNKLQWLRQDHTLTVKIPLRLEAYCITYSRNKIAKETLWEAYGPNDKSYVVRDVELKIKYEGDPQLFALNAQLGQNNQTGGFQAGPQAFEITLAQFQPNMPHHVGACPATKQIRVFYQGQGQGEIRIRVNAGNMPIHESGDIAFNANNGAQHYDFDIETPNAFVNNINNTVQHNLRVYVRGKGAGENTWSSDYQLMDQAVWKTRCTPVVNPVLGGNGVGGKAPGYQGSPQGGANAKPSTVKILPQAAPAKPSRKPVEPARPARQPIQ